MFGNDTANLPSSSDFVLAHVTNPPSARYDGKRVSVLTSIRSSSWCLTIRTNRLCNITDVLRNGNEGDRKCCSRACCGNGPNTSQDDLIDSFHPETLVTVLQPGISLSNEGRENSSWPVGETKVPSWRPQYDGLLSVTKANIKKLIVEQQEVAGRFKKCMPQNGVIEAL